MNITLKKRETMQDLVERLSESAELVYDIAPVAYWYEDLYENGRIKAIHFSKRMREMLGYNSVEEFPDELDTLMNFTHPDDIHIMLDGAIDAATEKTDKYDVQYRIRRADGSYMWCNATGELVKDYNGKTVGMYGAFINISKEIEAEKEQELLNEALDNDGVFLIDCVKNTRRTIHDHLAGAANYTDDESYSETFSRYVRCCVAESDREIMSQFISPEFILESTKENKEIRIQYQDITTGVPIYIEMRLVRYSDDEVLQSFSDKNQGIIEQKVFDLLLNEYDALYIADLDRNTIRPARSSRVSSVGVFVGEKSFSEVALSFAETVAPQYRDDWLTFSNPKFMQMYMTKEDHREYVYELPGTTKTMRRFSVDVFERVNGRAKIVLLSFMGIDNERAAAIRMHRQLAEQQIIMAESNRIIEALSEDFGCVNLIEFHDDKEGDTTVGYRTSELLKKLIPGWEKEKTFTNKISLLHNNLVYGPDKERFYEDTKRERVLEELASKDTYFVNTRLLIDNEARYYQIKFSAIREGDKLTGVVSGVHSIDAQKKREAAIQMRLEDALIDANRETQRNELIIDMFNASKWSYKIDANDEIVGASYAERAKSGFDIGHDNDPMIWLSLVHPDERDSIIASFRAAIADHTGNTPYDVTFRAKNKEGKYRWVKSEGRVIRRPDGSGEYIGMSLDIHDQMEEQRKRLLGAVPLSPDVLAKANIGMWAFELDEGHEPRMYVDDVALGLIGLDHQISPEETYHAWFDHIDENSYDLVTDAVEKMSSGEHAEVQYPWHHPDGHVMMVRCGGIRNYEYKNGIRIEGTHQDVTQTLHYDEEERKRAKLLENELVKSKLRADSLAYLADNEPDLNNAVAFFGKRILEISGCDQVIFRGIDGSRYVMNAPGIEDISQEICAECPFSNFDTEVYENGRVLMNDCREGFHGVKTHPDCPAKSSFMQHVYLGDKLVGLLSVHYLKENHTFTETGIDIMRTVAIYCGLLLGRLEAKKVEHEKMKAEASSRAKSEFLFNMSHDIRTPMNAIIGFTDKAIRHKENGQVLEDSLMKIKSSCDYLLSLVNDILEMARIESGKLELKEELHYAEEGSNTLLEVFGAEAARKNITLHTSVNVENKYLWLDETRTNQIIANLLSNAVKYTNPGGEIWFSVEQVPCERAGYGRYITSVKDTGRGMSREFLKKIFDSFERELSSTGKREQGTGLGMTIVKKIVDAMGAEIEVQSEPGKGTVVSLIAEYKLATPEEIESFKREQRNESTNVHFSLKGKRMLMVEDNELNREIASDILEEQGVLLEEAENGRIAVDLLKEKGPDYYDLILMDIQMPVMNGYDATRAIRSMYPDSKIPIVALSANAFSEDRSASIAAGMDDHVAKPIKVGDLFNVLAKFEPGNKK